MKYTINTKKAEEMTINGTPSAMHPEKLSKYMADCIQGFSSWALAASDISEIRQDRMQQMLNLWFKDFIDIKEK